MAYDVATILALHERDQDRPTQMPMRGTVRGEVRRNPSTDQKKARHKMTKSAADQAETESIPELLARAASASTLQEQQQLMLQVEQRQTEHYAALDAERGLDLSVKEAVEIVPRGLHELHTASTDWLMNEGLHVTANAQDAERALVAEASMWFQRCPDYVKADPEEFAVQARNLARRTASQYGEQAESAAQAFITEADRLYRQGQKTGSIKTAGFMDRVMNGIIGITPDEARGGEPLPEGHGDPFHPNHPRNRIHDLDNGGMTPDPTYRRPADPAAKDNSTSAPGHPPVDGHPGQHIDTTLPDNHDLAASTPHLQGEIDRHLTGQDASGVGEAAHGYAQHALRGGSLQHTAARVQEDNELDAALNGFTTTAGPAILAEEVGGAEGGAKAMGGGGMPDPGKMMDGASHALDSSADGVQADADNYARSQVTGASQVGQVGMNADTFPSGVPGYPSVDTSSNRSPQLQEIQGYQGWDGSSVVPQGDPGATGMNNDQEPSKDFASNPNGPGFPVPNSHAAKIAAQLTKESHMADFAACPNCGGHGRVAVRRVAYSGLPQIDQIVNADETPGATQLPPDVAFPLDPNWGNGQNVQNAIGQTEQQISERNSKSPLMSGTASYRQANAPDNSGWMGTTPPGSAPGGKGQPYPGYSAPTGYDGSSNEGYADPVYGYGGDQGDRPLQPYGEMEANDETNNPSQPYDPSVPHNNDQAASSVSPQISTMGGYHPDPRVAAQQRAILQAQANIRTLTGRG